MSNSIRILYVDDSPLDRELVRHTLEKENGGFDVVEAASRASFETAFANGEFDLILSDFNILGFEGLQVLEAVHAKDENLPVVIVTGTGSEEIAVEAMKRGAADYVIKTPSHIQRLPQTIHAALEKKRLDEERKQAEENIIASLERECFLGNLIRNASVAIGVGYLDGRLGMCNLAFQKLTGYNEDELKNISWNNVLTPPEWLESEMQSLAELRPNKQSVIYEKEYFHKSGKRIPIELVVHAFYDTDGNVTHYYAFITDLTQRKQAEGKIRRQLDYLTALQDIDRAIASALGMHLSLNSLISKAISLLAVDAAAVLLVNSATNTLHYTVGEGFRTNLSKAANIKLENGYAGRVALEQRIVKIPNPLDDPNNLFLTEFFKEDGFASYHGAPLIIKGKVIGVLEVFHRSLVKRDQEWLDFFNALAGQAAIAVNNAELFDNLQRSNIELVQAYDATIEGWSRAMDLRDKETEGHTLRVTDTALRLAALMSIGNAEQVQIRRGALLHDIGKLGVPDAILLKPGKLTDEEWVIMRQHPTYAYKMLSSVDYLKPALDIPYCHHEKWDGTGYPRGLKGEDIPFAARIFAVVDVWDALRSDRPYRASWSKEKVLDYIRAESGKHFDPQVVDAFLQIDE
jgi:PAS domain S-box-containing protein/putative nucleotidyltransferase with HDIG domain